MVRAPNGTGREEAAFSLKESVQSFRSFGAVLMECVGDASDAVAHGRKQVAAPHRVT